MDIKFIKFNKPPHIEAKYPVELARWYHKDVKKIRKLEVYKHTQAWKYWNDFRPLAPCVLLLEFDKKKGDPYYIYSYLVDLKYNASENKLVFKPLERIDDNPKYKDVIGSPTSNPDVDDVDVIFDNSSSKKL